jgi:NAD(P)-dependent dehydrogenase (short-subunit alcohol dehydrogenase family)
MHHRASTAPEPAPGIMRGKLVVVTGGTSGIGQAASERLAGLGARIVLVARDRVRGESALARLHELAPGLAHRVHYADLSRLAQAARVASEIAAAEPRIDVLINNAGALFTSRRRQVTEDGLELHFALNHMAYFVVTHHLLERLRAAAPARIVNTVSGAHRTATLDLDDLQSERAYGGHRVYARSKLCNVLFTRELARRLAGTDVTVNSVNPGFVATRFGDHNHGVIPYTFRLLKSLGFARRADQGAATIVHLASSPSVEAVTGGYFFECRPYPPNGDDATAQRLWLASARLAGIEARDLAAP